MTSAYIVIRNHHTYDDIEHALIQQMAYLIHPSTLGRYRNTPVTFANGNSGAAPEFIFRQLTLLLNNQRDMTPTEFYWGFEKIHPFTDGNGRVGSLLYNFLDCGLSNPEHPPSDPAW